jgi:hypothetical protein
MNWKPGETRNLPVGSRHHSAKISEADAMKIRGSKEMGVSLSKQYGISPNVVSKIRRGLLWKHIGGGL